MIAVRQRIQTLRRLGTASVRIQRVISITATQLPTESPTFISCFLPIRAMSILSASLPRLAAGLWFADNSMVWVHFLKQKIRMSTTRRRIYLRLGLSQSIASFSWVARCEKVTQKRELRRHERTRLTHDECYYSETRHNFPSPYILHLRSVLSKLWWSLLKLGLTAKGLWISVLGLARGHQAGFFQQVDWSANKTPVLRSASSLALHKAIGQNAAIWALDVMHSRAFDGERKRSLDTWPRAALFEVNRRPIED